MKAGSDRQNIVRYSSHICGRYQRGAEIIGKRWTTLIIKILCPGPLRFSALAEQLEVTSDKVLSERLKELEAEGIVMRTVYPESPVRVEYALTEKGAALKPVIEALEAWSERWMEAPADLADEADH
ncbi:MAG: helix-turn-helix transcriptional regulator [Anaerolineae bacterium]|nr:helix-turn-helix transcriptional regulator [Anaerolineae bacterium]